MHCRLLSIIACYLAIARTSYSAPTASFQSGQRAHPEILTVDDYKQDVVSEYAAAKGMDVQMLGQKLTRFLAPRNSYMSFAKQAFKDAVMKTAFYVDSVDCSAMRRNRETDFFLETVYDEFASGGEFASMLVFTGICMHNIYCLRTFDKPSRTDNSFTICRGALQLYSPEYYTEASSSRRDYVAHPWEVADVEKDVIQDLIRVYNKCFYRPAIKHAMMRAIYEMRPDEHVLINHDDNCASFNISKVVELPRLVPCMKRRILINNYLMFFLRVDVD